MDFAGSMMFIGPIIVLIITASGLSLLYSWLFSWLPKKIFNGFLGVTVLVGIYIWAIPFNVGFADYFKNWGI